MNTCDQTKSNAGERRPFASGAEAQPRAWADWAALALAVLVAAVFPLFFHDQFFDINRAKLRLLQNSTLLCTLACLVLFLSDHLYHRSFRAVRFQPVAWADMGITLFFVSAALATAFSDTPQQAFTGEAGRRSGLFFLLTLYLMYVVISRAMRMRSWVFYLYLAAGVAAALLGVLNFYQVDPLGFYRNMKDSQVIIFISTIGNINFFGMYICMVLCVAASLYLHVRSRAARALCALCAFLCFYASVAARSDGAVLGVALLFVLLAFAGVRDARRYVRVADLLALCAASLVCVRSVGVWTNWYGYPFQGGLCEAIVKSSVPAVLALAAAVNEIVARLLCRKRAIFPTRGLRIALGVLLGGAVAGALALAYYFTCVDTQAQLGALTQFLRFDDSWGTYRGFVWTRSLDAYGGLSFFKKLIGVGPDTMRYVLEPYRDAAVEAAANGVFENCHNEYLQYLLTTGAWGLCGYVVLLAGSLRDAYERRHTFEGLALLLMLGVYAPLAFVNVNQPVSVVQFFWAVSMTACLRNSGSGSVRKGEGNEPGSAARSAAP